LLHFTILKEKVYSSLWKNQEVTLKIKMMTVRDLLSNLLFPRFCVNCRKEGENLCQDCFSLIDLAQNCFCPFCRPPKIVLQGRACPVCGKNKTLSGLFAAASYKNSITKRLISQFKYEPFVKELAKTLASLIIQHFQLLDEHPPFFKDRAGFILMPVPLHKKRLKWRGFNQAEEIARHLSDFYKIPLISNVLLKIKETPAQVELSGSQRDKSLFYPSLRSGKAREENVKSVFFCKDFEVIRNKKILLVDDVFTTGATIKECARVLKDAGAKEVWGVAVARE
jgi:ComF family protein